MPAPACHQPHPRKTSGVNPTTLAEIEFKLFGVTMAAAVLIDATIVRGVLLPAGLSLLGDRAWRRPARRRALPLSRATG